jgi:ketosteroid isomerase-like protein
VLEELASEKRWTELFEKSQDKLATLAEKASADYAAGRTRETIQDYFESLKGKSGWEAFLSDEMVFTNFTSPAKRVTGRVAYLEATKRFFSMIKALEIKGILVDGERACALTRYELQVPGGLVFESQVAEVFEVRDGKIKSLDIYFDSAPFPK